MDIIKQYSNELERLTGGHYRQDSLYFTLNEIKHLPKIIQKQNRIDSIAIIPFHINENSIMEAYWLGLSIKVVNIVQDKNIVLLSEAGKNSLEEIEDKYIEQWDYTYYEIPKDDVEGFIECLNRYITYMDSREITLRKEYDVPNINEQGIYYEMW